MADAGAAVAALPMYDWPEVRHETDALWRALAEGLKDAGLQPPPHLDRRRDMGAVWRDPRLLLAQTCGLPYVRALRSRVRLLVTPCYDAPGCDGPRYCSVVVTRTSGRAVSLEQMRGRRLAYNASHSQSGYSALRSVVAPLARGDRFFAATLETGSHRESLRAVAGGRADLCAVDAVCWALARRHEPAAAQRLTVIARTPPTPGLPLICAGHHDEGMAARMRAAISEVLADGLSAPIRDALFIAGSEVLAPAAYDCIAAMESGAIEAGYPTLH